MWFSETISSLTSFITGGAQDVKQVWIDPLDGSKDNISDETGSWFGTKIQQVGSTLWDNPITRAVGGMARGTYSWVKSWSSPEKKDDVGENVEKKPSDRSNIF